MLMASRRILAALIVAATALFVVGIVLENNTGDEHGEATAHATSEESHAEGAEEGGEAAEGEAPASLEPVRLTGDPHDRLSAGVVGLSASPAPGSPAPAERLGLPRHDARVCA
jgi:hypothetical protein